MKDEAKKYVIGSCTPPNGGVRQYKAKQYINDNA